jgi:hypothetical protein
VMHFNQGMTCFKGCSCDAYVTYSLNFVMLNLCLWLIRNHTYLVYVTICFFTTCLILLDLLCCWTPFGMIISMGDPMFMDCMICWMTSHLMGCKQYA